MKKKPTKSVIPWPALVAVVVLLAGGLYFLIPDRSELIERYIASGEPEKAIALLQSEGKMDPVDAAVAYFTARSLLMGKDDAPGPWRELFLRGVEDYGRLQGPRELLEPMLSIIPRIGDPVTLWEPVGEELKGLPPEKVRPLQQGLLQAILAGGDPLAAAEFFRQTLPLTGVRLADVRELVRLRLAADQAEVALRELDEIERDKTLESGQRVLFALEKVRLLRLLNRGGEAFALLFGLWEDDPAVLGQAGFYEAMRSLSVETDRQAEVLPIIRARWQAEPENGVVFRDYLRLILAMGRTEEAAEALQKRLQGGGLEAEERQMLARILEWKGNPGEAFEHYRELVMAGDGRALERLFDLNEGLFRHYELAEIVQQAPDEAVAAYRLRAARLLSRIGEYEAAVETYRLYLRDEPEAAPEVYAELADIALTVHDFETAAAYFKRAGEKAPDGERGQRWRKDYAWVLSLRGLHREAMEEYRAIYRASGDEDVLPAIISLAALIGDYSVYRETLEELVARNPSFELEGAEARVFRQREFGSETRWRNLLDQYRRSLAQVYADEGDFGKAVETIRPHTRLYEDPAVFEFYLNVLAEEGMFHEGVAALENPQFRPELLRSGDSLRTAVWVLESGGRQASALRLAQKLYQQFPGDATIGLTVARLLAETGRTGEAELFLNRYIGTNASAEAHGLAVAVAAAAGNYARAEQHLLRQMEMKGERSAADLSRLGDLRLAAGDQRGSRESYRNALQALLVQEGRNAE